MLNLTLFYYTLVILLVSILAAALCLSAYLVSRMRTMLFACSGFLFYFFDVALVFQDDFILRGALENVESVYFVGSPLPSVIIGLGVFSSLWLLLCDFFGEKRRGFILAPIVVFVAGSLLSYFAIEPGAVQEFVFYSMRSVFLLWSLIYAGIKFIGSDEAIRERLWGKRFFYLGAWILGLAIIAKNVFTMFIVDPLLFETGVVPFFPERNFAENLLMLWCALFMCVKSSRLLSLHFKTPPADSGDKMNSFIDDNMAGYVARYGLSAREEDVLRLVLCGKDNQAIATTMNLALSTVKVHVHNILKKTGQANRQELMSDFRKRS